MDPFYRLKKISRPLALAFSILVIILGFYGATQIKTNPSLELFALSDSAEIQKYTSFQTIFPKEENLVIIGLKSKAPINHFQQFTAIHNLINRLEKSGHFREVKFLTNMNFPSKNGLFIQNRPFLSISNENAFQNDYRQLHDFPDITEKFLSSDKTAICLFGCLHQKQLNEKGKSQLLHMLNSLPEYEPFILGSSVFQHEMSKSIERDTNFISTLAFVFIFIVFLLFYPSVRLLVFFAWQMLFCVSAFYIVAWLLDVEFNLITSSIPVLIITLSLSDTVHIVSAVNAVNKDEKRSQFRAIHWPIWLTSFTTILGFAVFMIIQNQQILEFSLLAIVGLSISYLIARFWSPHLFWFLPHSKQPNNWKRLATRLHDFITARFKFIVFGTLLAFICGLWISIQFLHIDNFQADHLNPTYEPGKSIATYKTHFGGSKRLEIFVQGEDSLLTSEGIQLVDKIESYLLTNYGAENCFSINTIVKRFERFSHKGKPQFYQLPKNLRNVDRHLLLKHGAELGLYGGISKNLKTIRIVASSNDFGSKTTLDKNEKLKAFLASSLPKGMSFYVGGPSTIQDKAIIQISEKLVWSIVLGLLVTLVILYFLSRSFWMTFAGFIANALPLIVVACFYVLIDRNVGPSDLMLLSILLGVAIDDTIHFMSRYTQIQRQHREKNASQTVNETLIKIVKPTVVTSELLMVGFAALLFSFATNNQVNGVAFILGITAALIGDVLIVPAFLLYGERKDCLTLQI